VSRAEEASAIFAAPVTIVSKPAPPGHFIEDDNDPIEDDPKAKSNDDVRMREFGKPASGGDKRKIAAVVEDYYKLAVEANGVAACSLLYSTLAKNPTIVKVTPRDYLTPPPLPRVVSGENCARAASRAFTKEHPLLTVKQATLQVTGVRVRRSHAVAILGFRNTPQRWIPLTLERHKWKIDSLLDHELP
jgi:hypothetical protein